MKNKDNLKSKKGFTLYELLIVILIMGIVITAIYKFYNSSRAYTASVTAMNEYQNAVTDVMHRLRTELADCANVESFAFSATDTDGSPMYDLTDDDYGYISTVPVVYDAVKKTYSGGGVKFNTLSEVDGSREDELVVGQISSSKQYKIKAGFRSESNGELSISVSAIIPEGTTLADGTKTDTIIYEQTTVMKLRSSKESTTGGDALRYKLAS